MNNLLRIIFILMTIMILLLLSCEESTKPETVSYSGTVTLEGETDYSGVTVSLYKPVELDTAILRINQQYPQIGIQISQETEFDHRQHSPLFTTMTNALGEWNIENVTSGIYNVVAEKDSFGWMIDFRNESGNINFDLFKIIYLNSISNSTFVFESGNCYELNKDVFMLNMTLINFETNTKIILASNNDFRIHNSTLSFPDNGWVYITSDEGITNAKLLIEESEFSIDHLLVSSINKGIRINNCANGSIENSYFRDNGLGLFPEYCTNLSLNKIMLKNNNEGLLTIFGNSEISESIFIKNNEGLKNNASDIQFFNNLIKDNYVGITMISTQTSIVEHCEFDGNDNSSLNIVGTDLEVYNNNFLNDLQCAIRVGAEFANAGNCSPIIQMNNLFGSTLAISQAGNTYYSGLSTGNRLNIDASENYWASVIPYEIENRIDDYSNNSNLGIVNYNDIKLNEIPGTGISNK